MPYSVRRLQFIASYEFSVQADSSSYSASDMCGSPAIDFGYRDPGLLHKAKLSGLQPGLTYYYVCGDQQFGWSQEFSFRAAMPAFFETTTRVSAFGGWRLVTRKINRHYVW